MALALSAMAGVGSASASYLVAEKYPSEVEADAPTLQLTGAGGFGVLCEVSPVKTLLGEAESTFPIEPKFTGCKWNTLGHSATLSMNGCDLEFKPGPETSPGAFKGTLDIGPPGCGPVTLNDAFCKRSYAAQKGLAVSYAVSGGNVKATLSGASISGKTEGSPSGCAGSSTLSLYATWTFDAISALDIEQTVPGQPVGFFVSGGEPLFNAEAFPAELSGQESEYHRFTVPGIGGSGINEVLCTDVETSGTLSAASSSLALSADYGLCAYFSYLSPETELPADIEMNTCRYTVNLLKTGPPFEGTAGVACEVGGDAIEVTSYGSAQKQAEGKPLCHWRITPQSGLEGVSLANFGAEHAQGVSADFDLKGVAVTRVSGTIVNCGKANPFVGTYSGDTSLTGILG